MHLGFAFGTSEPKEKSGGSFTAVVEHSTFRKAVRIQKSLDIDLASRRRGDAGGKIRRGAANTLGQLSDVFRADVAPSGELSLAQLSFRKERSQTIFRHEFLHPDNSGELADKSRRFARF